MADGQIPSSDVYVRSIVEDQVRSLREIIRGVSQKEPLSDDVLFIDHLLQMVSLAAADGLDRRRTGGVRKQSASETDGGLTQIQLGVAKIDFVPQRLDCSQQVRPEL